jgi:chemotaxis protein methyltransferase CheR
MSSDDSNLTDGQVQTLLADVLASHGYDFTNYSHASIKRRIVRMLTIDQFTSFDLFRARIRSDKEYFNRFLDHITVNATEMFRDASFYKLIRERVIPALASLPHIRIWHAGCSTGEEVYSMAILLHEAGLLNDSELYATDINPAVLDNVRSGAFPAANMKSYAENYRLSGGTADFRSYYNLSGNMAKFLAALGRNTIVSHHNLVSDAPYRKCSLIMCRNVLIYFDKPLQDKILHMFLKNLEWPGFLALGSKETLRFSAVEREFEVMGEKVYRAH